MKKRLHLYLALVSIGIALLSAALTSSYLLHTPAESASMRILAVVGMCIVAAAAGLAVGSALIDRLMRPVEDMCRNPEDIGADAPYPEIQPFVDAIFHDRQLRRENESMRQEFTANVSHELKTPLTSISGYAELIETGMAKPEDVTGFARKIHKESNRLLSLVNDIIQLSQLDAAQQNRLDQESFEPVDLRDVVVSCFERLNVNAQHSFVTLVYHGEHATITGARASIEELCVNLCDNAIRYNEPGGKVVLSCGMREGHPYLRVQDNGIGIPPEQQERVFERFYRVDKSRSKETGGTGLGLAIVKHIAVIHNAQIELKSTLGEGTDICVLFPKRAAQG
jgi:two-component system phosphate regulon sensor histidine kinase PhoR